MSPSRQPGPIHACRAHLQPGRTIHPEGRRVARAHDAPPAKVPAARIVALPQPDWSLAPVASEFGDPREIARRIEAFNAILREEAEAAGARYVDIFPRMRAEAQRRAFAPDGLHPSAAAHDAWAEEIARRL
ncbi:MAG: GDSL-type esterase/lipase family protein [Minicystis sp.]